MTTYVPEPETPRTMPAEGVTINTTTEAKPADASVPMPEVTEPTGSEQTDGESNDHDDDVSTDGHVEQPDDADPETEPEDGNDADGDPDEAPDDDADDTAV